MWRLAGVHIPGISVYATKLLATNCSSTQSISHVESNDLLAVRPIYDIILLYVLLVREPYDIPGMKYTEYARLARLRFHTNSLRRAAEKNSEAYLGFESVNKINRKSRKM